MKKSPSIVPVTSAAVAATALILFAFALCLSSSTEQTVPRMMFNSAPFKEENLNMAIVSYTSNIPEETLLWGSTKAHHNDNEVEDVNDAKLIAVGEGLRLFNTAERTDESTRGWMFRLQTMVEGIVKELEERNGEDFIVVIGDAFDTYISETTTGNTLELVKERFLADFSEYSIVFSTQVYCCNPWNLREVGRAGWDEYYDAMGGPETLYKHLNAGMFIGKASAIIEMAQEMKVRETQWKRPEEFDDFLRTQGASKLHMFDADVDDDEWQLSVWFLKEQQKAHPRAALDMHQDLFTTSGTFRASHRDGGFLIFSQDDFFGVVGTLPSSFDESELDKVKQCPYIYDSDSKTWTNTITGGHPLIFHFAGNDWLCACQIMATDNYGDVTPKFAESCAKEFPHWQSIVNEGIQDISNQKKSNKQLFLTKDTEKATVTERHLLDNPYGPPSCNIMRFDLLDADSDTVAVSNFVNGSSICSDAYAVSIEAIADPCVRVVKFNINGSEGTNFTNTEFVSRFTLFSNTGNNAAGRSLNPGVYTVTAYPDGNRNKTKVLTFTSKVCKAPTTPIAPSAPSAPVSNGTAPVAPKAPTAPTAPVSNGTAPVAPKAPSAPTAPVSNGTAPVAPVAPSAPSTPVSNGTVPVAPKAPIAPSAPVSNGTAPVAPVAPFAPSAPVSNGTVPVAPKAPATPTAPIAPVAQTGPTAPVSNGTAPVASKAPIAPTAPIAPKAPIAPTAPVAPSAPSAPVSNGTAPVAPKAPIAPSAPVSNGTTPVAPFAPSAPMSNGTAPVAPVAPSAPSAPVSNGTAPVAPKAPTAPTAPVSNGTAPVAPKAPSAPTAPVSNGTAPVAPVAPSAPSAPVSNGTAPVAPKAPATPTAPIAPVAPSAPTAPVSNGTAPVAPFAPSAPVSNSTAPVAPKAPIAPSAPVSNSTAPVAPKAPIAPTAPVSNGTAPVAPVAPSAPSAPVSNGTAPVAPKAPIAPSAPVSNGTAPVAPVAPFAPSAPVSNGTAPVAPKAPATPTAPIAPVAQTGPTAPVSNGTAPVASKAPIAPTAPIAPKAPIAPTAPVSNGTAPVAPVAPSAPSAPAPKAPTAPTAPVSNGTAPVAPMVPSAPKAPVAPVVGITNSPTSAPTACPIDIDRFALWNATTEVVLNSDFGGNSGTSSYCRRRNWRITIEAIPVDDACIDYVRFRLTGPRMYNYRATEWSAPFFLFGMYNDTALNGRNLRVGNYTLTAFPNGVWNQSKVVNFSVKACNTTSV